MDNSDKSILDVTTEKVKNITKELDRLNDFLFSYKNVSVDVEILKLKMQEVEKINNKIDRLFEKVDHIEKQQVNEETTNKLKWGFFISSVFVLLEIGKLAIGKLF